MGQMVSRDNTWCSGRGLQTGCGSPSYNITSLICTLTNLIKTAGSLDYCCFEAAKETTVFKHFLETHVGHKIYTKKPCKVFKP